VARAMILARRTATGNDAGKWEARLVGRGSRRRGNGGAVGGVWGWRGSWGPTRRDEGGVRGLGWGW